MATPKLPVLFTPEGAVEISYGTLTSSPLSLQLSIGNPFGLLCMGEEQIQHAIEKAFGSDPHSLGITIIRDLPPSYASMRERLLKLANQFANLDEGVREKYADPNSHYSFGWSHGKEIMNGKPDTLKGSFYANLVDSPTVSEAQRRAHPEYYGENIWPSKDEKGLLGFEEAFKDLARFIFEVGCKLAAACQPFASAHLRDQSISLPDLIRKSQTTKARLLHYFPPPDGSAETDREGVDNWCGFHLDHSLLTGLCSAMFLRHEDDKEPVIVKSPSPSSGLYIRSRGGMLTKVSIPADCLAFQTGEALELATNGQLRATPHCVRVGGSATKNISRETFALFMQPETNEQISPEEDFGQFSARVFSEHYEAPLAASG